MRRLILLRHAKAVPQGEMADEDRPLSDRGHRDMAAAARFLADQHLVPDLALISPSRRTRETWELAASAFSRTPPHRFEARLYNATPAAILRLVRETPPATRSLLLIGHNPGFEEFARLIAASGDADALIRFAGAMPTASIAVFELPHDDWQNVDEKTGTLRLFATPKSLGARG